MKTMDINCTLCNTPLLDKFGDYYKCSICMAMVKHTSLYPNAEDEKQRYLAHVNDVNDIRFQNFTAPITNYIINHYSTSHLGLDFGCGTGPVITKVLRDLNYNVRKYDPYFAYYPGNLKYSYDFIAACEVVEHFYNPHKEFQSLFNLLKPQGSLVMMTLLYQDNFDFDTWYYRKDPTHVFIYRKETFEYICNQYGFRDLKIVDRLIVLRK